MAYLQLFLLPFCPLPLADSAERRWVDAGAHAAGAEGADLGEVAGGHLWGAEV